MFACKFNQFVQSLACPWSDMYQDLEAFEDFDGSNRELEGLGLV
jgi:hypothetical protein